MRIAELIRREKERQQRVIQLVASENLPSPDVVAVLQSTLLAYKTAEGLPGSRFHGGCSIVDEIERVAQDQARQAFNAPFANVQPNTASDANRAALLALTATNDRILVPEVRSGGHFSYILSGREVHSYEVHPATCMLDYDQIRDLARRLRPTLIVGGGSSYPREVDFAKLRSIADEVDAALLADVAHTAGFVLAGVHRSPVDHADIVTASTYKTLRGPRSGLLIAGTKVRLPEEELNRAVFPLAQGSPNVSFIAAKAVCLAETMQPTFSEYIVQVKANAATLAEGLARRGLDIVTGGTDTHQVLVDLSPIAVSGVAAEHALESVGVIVNRNLIPFDREPPAVTSGVRLGTAFATSRGLGTDDMLRLAGMIADVLLALHPSSGRGDVQLPSRISRRIVEEVASLAASHPLPSDLAGPG